MKLLGTFTILYDDGKFVYANLHQSTGNGFYEVKYTKHENQQLKRTLIESISNSNQFSENESFLFCNNNKNNILESIYHDIKIIMKTKFPALSHSFKQNLYYTRKHMYIINQHVVDYNFFVNEILNQDIDKNVYMRFTIDF